MPMQAINIYKYVMSLVRRRGHDASLHAANQQTLNKSFRDEGSCTHVLCTKEGCSSVLRDDSFVQPKIAEAVAEIGEQLELNVRAVEDFLRYNPIQLDGDLHKARRKQFLDEFNSKCKNSANTFKKIAEEKLVFFSKNKLGSLSRGLIEPFVDDVLKLILGSYDKNAVVLYESVKGEGRAIFEYVHSPGRLEEKSAQAESFIGTLAASGDTLDASREQALFLLSYILQGRDPLIGGLNAYMHSLLEITETDRLNRIGSTTAKELFWRSSPVNYIGRLATETRIVDGITLEPGDRVLLMLPWASHDESCTSKDSVAFGSGPHVCAGQALAVMIGDAWLSTLKERHQDIPWAGIKPDLVVPAVFRHYKDEQNDRCQ